MLRRTRCSWKLPAMPNVPPMLFGGGNELQRANLLSQSRNMIVPAPGGDVRGVPQARSTSFGVGDRTPDALAFREEEKRLAREKFLFDDMIVFDGGMIADYDRLPWQLIHRDLIHYALYHNKWGYHPKQFRKYRHEMINAAHDPIPYGSLRNHEDYQMYVGKINEGSPSWVTPSSMFQPYYGWVFADYVVNVMRAKFDPQEPLIVYDVGAGVGTFANSFLDYLAEHHPEIYEHCEYHLIEMNPQMIQPQRNRLVHHYHRCKIHNISIHNWREMEPRRCFVFALEVLCNMPHDCVVQAPDMSLYETWYELKQQHTLMHVAEKHHPVTDPIVLRYLRYLNWMMEESFNALKVLCMTDGQENILPRRWETLEMSKYDHPFIMIQKMFTKTNPYRTLYLPTGQMLFLEVLAKYFPRHHGIFVDWNQVLQPIGGINGPVPQIKMRVAKNMFVRKALQEYDRNAGQADICFPTDFDFMEIVYRNICGEHKEITNMMHTDFWKVHGGDKTAIFSTVSGFNPLLEDFKQMNVFSTHHPAEM